MPVVCVDGRRHSGHCDGMSTSVRPRELNLANWDLGGPVSQWSYWHAEDLFPSERLEPKTPVDSDDRPVAASAASELADDLRSGLVSAITILVGGRTVFRWPLG